MPWRSISWQLWYIFRPRLTFLLVEESPSLCRWPSESRYGFPSPFSTLWNSLVQGLPSLQGFSAFFFIKPRGLISWVWWLLLGCSHLRPWFCGRQRSVSDLLPLVYPQWIFPRAQHETVPNWPCKRPRGKDHSLVASLSLMVESNQYGIMVTAMDIRQQLPHTSQSESLCGDCEVYCRCRSVHVLGLGFQIGVGSVIKNTQTMPISEYLNDFTPGVNIMTAP